LAALQRKQIDVVTAEVSSIDPAARTVRVGRQEISGDALVIAFGADLAEDAISGPATAGHDLYTLRGAAAIRDALATFGGGRSIAPSRPGTRLASRARGRTRRAGAAAARRRGPDFAL
jgi:sulfide:quinone oxidoreductase